MMDDPPWGLGEESKIISVPEKGMWLTWIKEIKDLTKH